MSDDLCVECCLPDFYGGHGDGIGSCDCPRCECGNECGACSDALGLCYCETEEDVMEEEPCQS